MMPRNPDIPGAFPVWRTLTIVAACSVVIVAGNLVARACGIARRFAA